MQEGDTIQVKSTADWTTIKHMFDIDVRNQQGIIREHCHGTGEKGNPNAYYVQFGDDHCVMFDFELEVAS